MERTTQGGSYTTRPRSIKHAEKVQTAMELRRSGATIVAIGKSMGITRKSVWRLLQKGIAQIVEEVKQDALAHKAQELDRLDRIILANWQKALEANPRSAEVVLRAIDARCRILGINAPQKIAPTDPDGREPYTPPERITDNERAARIAAILERARQGGA
jgi:transposase-like protein